MKKNRVCALAVLAALALATAVSATTWFDAEVDCPICGTSNTFQEIGSYGGYIYSWPSKYQFIFWPLTDRNVVYSCRKCRLTCLMWDFQEVPEEKHGAIGKALEKVAFEGDHKVYSDIPMTQRLDAAEKVYKVLGRDDEFWCKFYRVVGYHHQKAGDIATASDARRKALEIARKMLKSKENDGIRKELLLISGAMRHFLGDDDRALADFRAASKLKYRNASIPQENVEGLERYLTELLAEYIEAMEGAARSRSQPGIHRTVFEALKTGDAGRLDSVMAGKEELLAAMNGWKPGEGRDDPSWADITWGRALADVGRDKIVASFAEVRQKAEKKGFDWAGARLAGATVHDLALPYHNERTEPILRVFLTMESKGKSVCIRLDGCPDIGGKRKLAGTLSVVW